MPPTPSLPRLLLSALLSPERFVATLNQRADWWRWVILLWVEVGVALGGLMLVVGVFVPLTPLLLLIAAGLGVACSFMSAFGCILSLPTDVPHVQRTVLSITRAFIALGIPISLVIVLIVGMPEALPVVLVLLLLGMWIGSLFMVALLVSTQRHGAFGLRWLVLLALLVIAGMFWWLQPLESTDNLIIAVSLVGAVFGILRPLSYLWTLPLSLLLALLARLRLPAQHLLAAHPVAYDTLGLLPLFGLPTLLLHACRSDVALGGAWLVQVAEHPAQAWAARRCLRRLLQQGEAHPILFWLSMDAAGIAWLRRLARDLPAPHALVLAYTAIAQVESPAAWPGVIAQYRGTWQAAVDQAEGAAIWAMLDLGLQTLQADRWPVAMQALRETAMQVAAWPDPFSAALRTLVLWSDARLPTLIHDRAQALAVLWDDLELLDGWPAHLLDAMAEHLVYLLLIEYQRGRWLV